jgi:hypothetical protein
VHEHVLAAFHGDETEALSVVEPLDSTSAAHVAESPSWFVAKPAKTIVIVE